MICENKSNANNGRGNLNCLKIIQKMPKHHTGEPRQRGATENSHTGHCAHISEGDDVKVQKVYHGKYE